MSDETSRRPGFAFPALIGSLGVFMLGGSVLLLSLSKAELLPVEKAEVEIPAATPPERPSEYALVQLGEYRRDQFLVDRTTGRVWQSTCLGEVSGADCKGLVFWDEMYVMGITPESSSAAGYFQHQLQKRHEPAPKK